MGWTAYGCALNGTFRFSWSKAASLDDGSVTVRRIAGLGEWTQHATSLLHSLLQPKTLRRYQNWVSIMKR